MRRYMDLPTLVINTEFDTGIHAVHVQHFAMLVAPNRPMPPVSWLPGGANHRNTLPSGVVFTSGTNGKTFAPTLELEELSEGAAASDQYGIGQNFPNPFNAETQIIYQLPEPGQVSLTIYNILGSKGPGPAARLADCRGPPGHLGRQGRGGLKPFRVGFIPIVLSAIIWSEPPI